MNKYKIGDRVYFEGDRGQMQGFGTIESVIDADNYILKNVQFVDCYLDNYLDWKKWDNVIKIQDEFIKRKV